MSQIPNRTKLPRYSTWAAGGLLLLAVGLVFGQTVRHGLINLDDAEYVSQNPSIAQGLSAEGFLSALTQPRHFNWCPLTWWSFMLDYQLYGLRPWGYHLTNVLLHSATVIALFLVLRRMTGHVWPSALVAALFAVHPLRAESVAWVTERKDVLSGLFFMLAIGAYVGYAGRPFSLVRYGAVLLLFALGLMAKPMVVTLPFVLLLLDYWPLGRMQMRPRSPITPGRATASHFSMRRALGLVVEKTPMLAMAAASCAVTLWAQHGLVVPYEHFSLYWRIGNVLVSYAVYLRQFLWPTGLALWYPLLLSNLQGWKILASLGLLVAITAGALVVRRRCPYVLVGWLWYVGMLVPVIGVVQVTDQAMADRFTYLPQIGLGIALVWGLGDRRWNWLRYRWACGVGSALALAILMGWAWRQASFWRDSETLWRHTLACTSQNSFAHNNLGAALTSRGQVAEAVAQYRMALEIKPDDIEAHNNLGETLRRQGKLDEAIAQFRRALAINPRYAEAHYNLGIASASQGRLDEAENQFRQTLKIEPNHAEAHNNLGAVLAFQGRLDEAAQHYREAIRIKPDNAEARNNLAMALHGQGKIAEAAVQWREAVRLQPNQVAFANCLAWVLATCPEASVRNGPEAVKLARRAVQLSGGREPAMLGTLAAAYAEAGRFAEAVQTARQALELATQQNNQGMADALRAQIALYEAGKPCRQ